MSKIEDIEKIEKIIKDANMTLEQRQELHRLLRDDIIDKTLAICRRAYDKAALERNVKVLEV
jgi:hypothetical protein